MATLLTLETFANTFERQDNFRAGPMQSILSAMDCFILSGTSSNWGCQSTRHYQLWKCSFNGSQLKVSQKKLDPGMKIKIVSCKKIKDWSETEGTVTGSNCIKTSCSSHNLSRTWQSKHKNLHVTKLNPAIWSLRQKDENPGMVSYVTAAKSLLIGLGDRLSVTQKLPQRFPSTDLGH